MASQEFTKQALLALSRLARKVREIEYTIRQLMFGYIVPCEFRKFELKESLTAGSSAVAYLRYEDPNGGGSAVVALVTDTTTTFTVYDDIGDLTGTGRDDAGSAGVGAYGKAMKWPNETLWYIYDLECP